MIGLRTGRLILPLPRNNFEVGHRHTRQRVVVVVVVVVNVAGWTIRGT